MAGPSVRALIIQPNGTYEIREVKQDRASQRELVDGETKPVFTDHCVLWCDEEGKLKPLNALATYLWWNLAPEAEGRDALQGTVFVTGLSDEAMDSTPVPDAVIDLFERMEVIFREEQGG